MDLVAYDQLTERSGFLLLTTLRDRGPLDPHTLNLQPSGWVVLCRLFGAKLAEESLGRIAITTAGLEVLDLFSL